MLKLKKNVQPTPTVQLRDMEEGQVGIIDGNKTSSEYGNGIVVVVNGNAIVFHGDKYVSFSCTGSSLPVKILPQGEVVEIQLFN